MFTSLSRRLSVLFAVSIGLAVTAAPVMADQISNTLDGTVDAAAEVMPLNAHGTNGTTMLSVTPGNDDGKQGCNLTGSKSLTVSIGSSDTTVATVSPSSITFGSCGDLPTITVTPHDAGSAVVSLVQTSNTTGGTFDLAPATFQVNVVPPANHAPAVSVTGFTPGAVYELGVDTLPTPGCSATDDEDGPSSPAPLIDDQRDEYGLGTVEVTCSYTDLGGLTATSSATYTVVDTLAPTITYAGQDPAANGNGWNNGSVTLTWTCDDGQGSGVVDANVHQVVSTEGAAQAATGTCTDRAGHTASDTQYVSIDETAPGIDITRTPAANAGWNNTDVLVSWTCTDALSGPVDASGSSLVDSEGAGQSRIGVCEDKAGNTTTQTVSDINIDKTPPTVSLVDGPADGASYYFGQVLAAPTCEASDDLSGLAADCSVSGYSPTVGTHTVTASATDIAGNEGIDSRSYEVKAWTLSGFYAPVNMGDNIWNTVKGGSTVPLKFEAFMGSTEITDVTTLGASFTVKGVACPGSSALTDDIEMTTSGGTTLRYDATAGHFIQNWQTPKKAGACYQVTMTSADGSDLHALFKLK